jgi:hypothetical protein
MAVERKAITFEEFSGNLTGFFDFVCRRRMSMFVSLLFVLKTMVNVRRLRK